MTTLKTLTETASDLGRQAMESAGELGLSGGRRLDEARLETGDVLHAAASSVRTTGDAIGNLATGTADRLDASASYVENHDLRAVSLGLRSFARRHLTGSLVTAVAIGFLAGSALRRATHSCQKASAGA